MANAAAWAAETGSGTATANAVVVGRSGIGAATSTFSNGVIISGSLSGSVSDYSRTVVEAQTIGSVGQAATPLSAATGLQAVAFATALPQAGDLNSLLAGNTNVSAAGVNAANALAIVTLGGAYPLPSGTGSSVTYIATATFTLGAFTPGTLEVGFLSAVATGFDNLSFQVLVGGSTVIDQNFSTLASAQSYFQDQALSLGAFSGNTTSSIDLGFTSHTAADSFAGQLVLADVPEPGTLWITILGSALILPLSRRLKSLGR
jgi:hypothetical protein